MITIETANKIAKEKFGRELNELDMLIIEGLAVNGEVVDGVRDDRIIDEAIERNKKLWNAFKYKFARKLIEKGYVDDAEDLMYIAIAKAVLVAKKDLKEYQTLRYAFTTYVGKIYQGYVNRWKRDNIQTKKRQGVLETLSLNETLGSKSGDNKQETLGDIVGGTEYIEDEIEAKLIYEQLLQICDRLNINKDLIRLAYLGYKQKAIGECLGVGQAQVSRFLKKVYNTYKKEVKKNRLGTPLSIDEAKYEVSINKLSQSKMSDRCKRILLGMVEEELLSQQYGDVANG